MIYSNPQAELQKLVYDLLVGTPAVLAQADDVYDMVPPDPFSGVNQGYISFGATDVVVDDAECIVGGEYTLQIDCWSRQHTSVHCKRMVDAVYRTLHHPASASLSANALVDMEVTLRQVMRDPDGLTTHGLLQVTATIEEPLT